MFTEPQIMKMARMMATHAAQRQNIVAGNIANADTPGYVAQDVPAFSKLYDGGDDDQLKTTRAGHLNGIRATDTSFEHPLTASEPSPNGNTVSLETEMVKSVEVKREHDLALAIYKNAMTVLRSSLGRN